MKMQTPSGNGRRTCFAKTLEILLYVWYNIRDKNGEKLIDNKRPLLGNGW